MTAAYIALGSNLGDRRGYLDQALEALNEQSDVRVSRVSNYYETAPVGGPSGQGRFLNAAAELQTELPAEELLGLLLAIEQSLGRVRRERHGPRTIDLDLLLYGDQIIQSPKLTVPHPLLHERRFVLEPLAEIAPSIVHPILHKTVQELLAAIPPQGSPGWKYASGGTPGRELTGLRAMVTGSTSGIGQAIAVELAGAGADVLVHGRRAKAAEETAHLLQKSGVRTGFLLADLHEDAPCRKLVHDAWQVWGGLDIWINNAGADTLTGEAVHWSFERKLAELWAVDVGATVLLSRAAGQRLKEGGGGVLLNMGWDQAEHGMEGDSGQLFAAVKGAVMAFSKSLALTLAPEVRVNCLAPGWIRTAWGHGASQTWQDRVQRETPLHRWGTPEDVAKTARWLASPAAAFITGQVIRINGGVVR